MSRQLSLSSAKRYPMFTSFNSRLLGLRPSFLKNRVPDIVNNWLALTAVTSQRDREETHHVSQKAEKRHNPYDRYVNRFSNGMALSSPNLFFHPGVDDIDRSVKVDLFTARIMVPYRCKFDFPHVHALIVAGVPDDFCDTTVEERLTPLLQEFIAANVLGGRSKAALDGESVSSSVHVRQEGKVDERALVIKGLKSTANCQWFNARPDIFALFQGSDGSLTYTAVTPVDSPMQQYLREAASSFPNRFILRTLTFPYTCGGPDDCEVMMGPPFFPRSASQPTVYDEMSQVVIDVSPPTVFNNVLAGEGPKSMSIIGRGEAHAVKGLASGKVTPGVSELRDSPKRKICEATAENVVVKNNTHMSCLKVLVPLRRPALDLCMDVHTLLGSPFLLSAYALWFLDCARAHTLASIGTRLASPQFLRCLLRQQLLIPYLVRGRYCTAPSWKRYSPFPAVETIEDEISWYDLTEMLNSGSTSQSTCGATPGFGLMTLLLGGGGEVVCISGGVVIPVAQEFYRTVLYPLLYEYFRSCSTTTTALCSRTNYCGWKQGQEQGFLHVRHARDLCLKAFVPTVVSKGVSRVVVEKPALWYESSNVVFSQWIDLCDFLSWLSIREWEKKTKEQNNMLSCDGGAYRSKARPRQYSFWFAYEIGMYFKIYHGSQLRFEQSKILISIIIP